MFQISESVIADLIEGTNYKYVFAKENKIIYTNLLDEINHNKTVKNKLKVAIKFKGKGLTKKHTKHIIREKFVHSIQWGNSKVCIFTNKKNCPVIDTLFNCIIILIIESAQPDYKNHYFYKEIGT